MSISLERVGLRLGCGCEVWGWCEMTVAHVSKRLLLAWEFADREAVAVVSTDCHVPDDADVHKG